MISRGRPRVEALDLRGPRGIVFAIAGSLGSVGAQLLLREAGLGDGGFIVYVPAIALAAWLGGGAAGVVATLVCAVANDYLFVEPVGSLLSAGSDDLAHLLIFLGTGALISGISSRLRHAVLGEARAHQARESALSSEREARTRAEDLARRLSDTTGELRRSRDQLAAVIESVTDAIILQAPDGRFLYANEEAARIIGYHSTEELIASPFAELVAQADMTDEHGESIGFSDTPPSAALRGEQAPERLIGIRIHGGGPGQRWARMRSVPVGDEAGQVRFAVTIFREVTAQRRAAQARPLLVDSTALLSTSLDARETIERLAALAVQDFADWCAVHLTRADGSAADSVLAYSEPLTRRQGVALPRSFQADLEGASPVASVIRTGQPVHITDVGPDAFDQMSSDPAVQEVLRGLALRSYICAPIVSRGKPIGAISLATTAGRGFDRHELEVITEVSRRVGAFLENIRLYRAADARQAELAAVLASLRDAVMVYDEDDHLRLRNPAADVLLESRPPETLRELTAMMGVTREQWLDDGSNERDGGRPEVRLSDGRWLELSGSDVRGSTVLLARDVSAARSAQAAREAFIGLLSHELRTPITTIYGGTRLLDRPLAKEQRDELVRDVRAEAERLFRLVEDLLVMTRVERGGVDIGDEPILLQRLITGVVHVEEARWPGLTVRLAISERLPAVLGDPTYVEQVVRNLVTNAAKYGGTDKPVDMAVEDHGEEVWVRVCDRGPGISGEESEQLFELFYRGSSTSSAASGAGIGLFVCRALVTAMGGRLWAAPREGGGAEFGFSLPVLHAEEAA